MYNRYAQVKLKSCLSLSSSDSKALSPLATYSRRKRRQFVAEFGDYNRQCGQGLSRLGVAFVPSGVHFADLSHSQV